MKVNLFCDKKIGCWVYCPCCQKRVNLLSDDVSKLQNKRELFIEEHLNNGGCICQASGQKLVDFERK